MIATLVRRLGGLGLAFGLACGLLASPATAPEVRAAAPDLTIVADATYTVQPEQHRVRVNLNLVLTNHLKDTVTKRYFFDRAFLAVLPGTSGFKFSWDGKGTPEVHVSKKTADYTLLRLDLGQRLFSGKSATYKLRFDLVDPGGEPTRDVRIGETLASFPVWAFATDSTSGGSVKVIFPAGFDVDVEAGEVPEPSTAPDGRVVFTSGELDEPLSFFAYLVGDRPGAYAERSLEVSVGGAPVDVTVRAWPDDAAWLNRVSDLVERALPELARQIGMDWRLDGPLVVQEAASRSTGGYAGLFDPAERRVEVAYYAEDDVVLHELAHAWFNGSLLADRWANEGFASAYAAETMASLGLPSTVDELTEGMIDARIPLNAWGPIGREETATEDYAYVTSLDVAQAAVGLAGPAVMPGVWADAAARIGAYQPPAGQGLEPETVDGPPDWRGLLDLLEEHSGQSFEAEWRRYVVRDTDMPLLDARRDARARYQEILDAAGDWHLPRTIRDAMRAWQFDVATQLLHDADRILAQRTEIGDAATGSGLTPPATLETAFELRDGFATASAEATAELEVIERFDAAVATRPAEPDVLQVLGMWGATPEADLARARDLFAAGDLAAATDAAGAAASVWFSAEDVGRGRLVSLGALVLALLLAIALFVGWLRGRRRRRRRFAAHPIAGDPYATLAATPEPATPAAIGDEGRRGVDPD
jgi:hypothetical protein